MKNYSAKEIKNIVLIGAPGSGKTTLAEAMAYEGKVIDEFTRGEFSEQDIYRAMQGEVIHMREVVNP